MEDASLYQVAILIDQLKHEETGMRVAASRELVMIAKALGPERTRDELIPFLNDSMGDEDEVLQEIAEKLGDLLDYIGGPQFAYLLLAPLEQLAAIEESTVREMAVASAERVAAVLPENHITEYLAPCALKLVSKEWFTCRNSAATLIPIAYGRCCSEASTANLLVTSFVKLCGDDTPMVRREAATKLAKMVHIESKASENGQLLESSPLMHVFLQLADDEQDSVRIQAVPNCIEFAKILPHLVKNKLLSIIKSRAQDRSWRIRWSLATHIHEVVEVFSDSDDSLNELQVIFGQLLQDTEAEVRATAASKFTKVCDFFSLNKIVPKLMDDAKRLVMDTSEHVRTSLAEDLQYISPKLGRDGTVEHLLPILLILLRDECSDVRLAIVSNLQPVHEVIGIDLLNQSLLPAITGLAADTQWRVRLSILEKVPDIAEQLGSDVFQNQFDNQLVNWLSDSVYSVRRAASDVLLKLSKHFGEDWTKMFLISKLVSLLKSTNYLHRVTALYGIQTLASVLSSETVETQLLPQVLLSLKDNIPNVRIIAARVATTLYWNGQVDSVDVKDNIMSVLKSAAEDDADRDVRYFANSGTVPPGK
jgi:serine/threonine-protein phosphatase 2A regulatory subunit A